MSRLRVRTGYSVPSEGGAAQSPYRLLNGPETSGHILYHRPDRQLPHRGMRLVLLIPLQPLTLLNIRLMTIINAVFRLVNIDFDDGVT
jgi:hypothetical protein